MDEELFSKEIQVERKRFLLSLRSNARGRFLRITEDVGGRRDTIIIPSTGLTDLCEAIAEAAEADGAVPQREDAVES